MSATGHTDTPPRHLRVFLASPGDVAEERAAALRVLEQLQYDPLLRGEITVETVAWDKPGAGAPMLATLTPQEAIKKGLPTPAECDIVIVVFWSRMGTPLPQKYKKADGRRYLSGTEWEYLNALEAAERQGKPEILVYRRTAKIVLDPDDPEFDEKSQQWRLVKQFFYSFENPDGSLRRGYNAHVTPDEFREQLNLHLRSLIRALQESKARVSARHDPPVTSAEVVPTLRATGLDDSSAPNLPAQRTGSVTAVDVPPSRLESKPSPAPVPSSPIASGTVIAPEPGRSIFPKIHGWSAQQVQTLQQQTAQALGLPIEFRDRLQDDSPGPLMVVIPGGLFVMGSPTNEPGRGGDERRHKVELKPFAMGKYAVTFEEYDYFADDTERDRPGDGGWGRGRRPVINVTWHDAMAYAEWLSQQTGQVYRLPTEAEWEYACRAGTTTAYHFGAAVNTDLACYCGGGFFKSFIAEITGKGTVEVGRYPANAWGLHDMHGNVWEWSCSEYDASYGGAEQRCVDKEAGGPRVLRGGSWNNRPGGLRAAHRTRADPADRLDYGGFRLARTFPF